MRANWDVADELVDTGYVEAHGLEDDEIFEVKQGEK